MRDELADLDALDLGPRPDICAWCGEPFTRQRSTRRYCSSQCRSSACRARKADRARHERWATADVRHCEWCSGPLPVTARPDQVYCDRACKQAAYRHRVQYADAVALVLFLTGAAAGSAGVNP